MMPKDFESHKNWYANQIAKTFLAGTGSLDLLEEGNSKEEDFIIRSKVNGEVYSVDVKPSKYRLSEIKREYQNLRTKYAQKSKPTVMMYINYADKTGYFEVIANGHSVGLTELEVSKLKAAIS